MREQTCLRPLALLLLGTLFTSAATAGDVLKVSPGGGAAYHEIQPAVDAAADGDTIYVFAGDYAGFHLDGKGLSILGRPGNVVNVFGTIRLENLGADQHVLLSGLVVNPSTIWPENAANGLEVRLSLGSVRVEGCLVSGQEGAAYEAFPRNRGGDGALLEGAADVSFHASTVQGGNGAEGFGGFHSNRGGNGIRAEDSALSVHDSTCLGARGGPEDTLGDGQAGDSGHGISLAGSSHLFAQDARSEGGAEAGGDGIYPGIGGHGLFVQEAPAHAELLEVLLTGGPGTFPGLPLKLQNGGTAHRVVGAARVLETPRAVHESSPMTFVFRGEPGDRAYLLVAMKPGRAFLPNLHGTLLTGLPLAMGRRYVGVIPASGELVRHLGVPALPPAESALNYHLQSLHEDAAGMLWLGSPSTLVVLDSSQ